MPPINLFFLFLIVCTFIAFLCSPKTSTNAMPPIHLCFLFLILFTFITFPWYVNYESMFFEGLYDQLKLVLIFSPLILLVVVHLVSRFGDSRSPFFMPFPERDSTGGGTPWGVGLFLVLLFFMISYQSSLQERWFPLHSKS